MMSFFYNINPPVLAFIMGIITFLITMFGAALVYIKSDISSQLSEKIYSLSAGIMLSSTIFSLINPMIDNSIKFGYKPWLMSLIGILSGGLLLYIIDKFDKRKNGIVLPIVIHNIPEGLAIGVAFGLSNDIALAMALAIGIGIQNFPEGFAISFPLYKGGYTKNKSFLIGSFSAIVEPIFALLGALIVVKAKFLLPFSLAFASGAMLYVIVTELIPECMLSEKKELNALYFIIGFIIMMILDISL